MKLQPKRSRPPLPRMGDRRPKAAIVHVPPAPVEKPWELDSEAVTILKNSIAKGATDDELKFCLAVARRYKVDPFKRQIWFVRRWDASADDGKGGRGRMVYTPQLGIDGMLFIAARDHKDFGSVSLPQYGPMFQAGAGIKAPEWVRVKVWKKGEAEPTEAEAWWDEYAPDIDAKTEKGAYKAPFWRKMPRRMLAKCAVALAIRQAYPDLGGLYIPEEMERMGEDITESGRQIVRPMLKAELPGHTIHYTPEQQAIVDAAKAKSSPAALSSEAKTAGAGSSAGQPAPAVKKVPGLVTLTGADDGKLSVNVALASGKVRDELHAFLTGDKVNAEWLEGPKIYLCHDTPDIRFDIKEKCIEMGVEGVVKAGKPGWKK